MAVISMSLIKELEKNGVWDSFRGEYDALHKRDRTYANSIVGCMELAHHLNSYEVPYFVIGGLAVAMYVHQVDHEGFLKWRGTDDIDLVVPNLDDGKKALVHCGYRFMNRYNAKEGSTGPIYNHVRDENGETIVAGLRTGVSDLPGRDITRELLKNVGRVDLWSIPVQVPAVRALTEMKKFANRAKDRADIKLLRIHYAGIKL